MNRRNFMATIAGAMAYAGLRMDAPKAPEQKYVTGYDNGELKQFPVVEFDPIPITNWANYYVTIAHDGDHKWRVIEVKP